jgi:hypothetical protein
MFRCLIQLSCFVSNRRLCEFLTVPAACSNAEDGCYLWPSGSQAAGASKYAAVLPLLLICARRFVPLPHCLEVFGAFTSVVVVIHLVGIACTHHACCVAVPGGLGCLLEL